MVEDWLRTLSAWLGYQVTPTLSVALVLWIGSGVVSMRYCATRWWIRRRVLNRAVELKLAEREIVLARQRHAAEAERVVYQVAFLLVGIAAATAEPPAASVAAWQYLLATPVLLAVQVGLAVMSWRQAQYDRALLKLPRPKRDRLPEVSADV